jgi:hypothetical protein
MAQKGRPGVGEFSARSYETKNGDTAWQPLIEFAEGAQQVREQFRKQALEAIHTAADEQQQADANSGGRL